ncbi:MAG: DHA2 family efflux MFS transporter permease subunit [Sphingomonadales bacterium]|nr:DHA2 family efflux MFS transporter permease subunit [Sphingomonadales bacterium]
MLATTPVAIDTTIANVALPHMQSTMSASQEQVVWVLTSYIIASAIATPLSSWLAGRYGRKTVMLTAVSAFTLASVLCGLAANLAMLVLARTVQGATGAALIPLSQSSMLDTYPPADLAKAMAFNGLGSMLGPLVGPTFGGWLTDSFTWRWVFFINVPFGVLSIIGMTLFLPERRSDAPVRFDMFGFATLSLALASLQLLLDRGQHLDWLDSIEIRVEAACLVLFGWLALVHTLTGRDTFVRPTLFRDRNFAVGCLLSITVGVVTFATIPIITLFMQGLLGFSALRTGMVSSPRAIGTLIGILAVTRMASRFDMRALLFFGLALTGFSQVLYSRMDLLVDVPALLTAGLVQGIGSGFLVVPLSMVIFATLPAALRNEGAAMFALTRNIGSSVSISLMQVGSFRIAETVHSRLAEGLRPDSPVLQWRLPDVDFAIPSALTRLGGQISREAMMIAYLDMFRLVALAAFLMLPLILLLRSSAARASAVPVMAME